MTAAILTEIAAILTEMMKRIESLLQTPSTTAFGRLLDGNTELRQKRKKGIALYMVKMEMGDCKSPLSPVSPLHLLYPLYPLYLLHLLRISFYISFKVICFESIDCD
ncbi:MAG: hypothetical protein IJ142_08960 [Bacteroidaceae bacterium]|nr:hypothetical protein [Bacteroidaceae bacterium]